MGKNSVTKKNKLLIDATAWMNFKYIRVSERCESERASYYIFLLYDILKNGEIKDRKQINRGGGTTKKLQSVDARI